jgi:hypothetical protein
MRTSCPSSRIRPSPANPGRRTPQYGHLCSTTLSRLGPGAPPEPFAPSPWSTGSEAPPSVQVSTSKPARFSRTYTVGTVDRRAQMAPLRLFSRTSRAGVERTGHRGPLLWTLPWAAPSATSWRGGALRSLTRSPALRARLAPASTLPYGQRRTSTRTPDGSDCAVASAAGPLGMGRRPASFGNAAATPQRTASCVSLPTAFLEASAGGPLATDTRAGARVVAPAPKSRGSRHRLARMGKSSTRASVTVSSVRAPGLKGTSGRCCPEHACQSHYSAGHER